MVVDERALTAKLDELAQRLPEQRDVIEALGALIRSADDRDVVRINPIDFARERSFDEQAVIDGFLHARKAGLVHMEWDYVCPGCGDIVESFATLTSATAHYFCQVCSANRDADLSDFVEITLGAPGAEELLTGYALVTEAVDLKGIHGAVRIHRVARTGS